MPKPKLDSNGVPVLSHADIEERPEVLLSVLAPACLEEPLATPIAAIAEKLVERRKMKLNIRANLGHLAGRKVRGCFDLKSKTVCIDRCLEPGSGQFNFTLAHEIGHFLMHGDVSPKAIGLKLSEVIEDGDRDLLLNQLVSDNPRTLIEWQANKFASCLLLPKSTFLTAIENEQKKMGINRNIGKVFIGKNDADYSRLIQELGLIYQVSRSVLRIRMQELGVLNSQKPARPHTAKTVNDVLINLFNHFEP